MAGRKPWTKIASVTKPNPAPIARDLIDLMARPRPSRRPPGEGALQQGVDHESHADVHRDPGERSHPPVRADRGDRLQELTLRHEHVALLQPLRAEDE